MESEHLIPKRLETKKLIISLVISEDPLCDEFGEIYKIRLQKSGRGCKPSCNKYSGLFYD